MFLTDKDGGALTSKGIYNLKYFTVLSNIFCGGVAVAKLVSDIKGKTLPLIWKLLAATESYLPVGIHLHRRHYGQHIGRRSAAGAENLLGIYLLAVHAVNDLTTLPGPGNLSQRVGLLSHCHLCAEGQQCAEKNPFHRLEELGNDALGNVTFATSSASN